MSTVHPADVIMDVRMTVPRWFADVLGPLSRLALNDAAERKALGRPSAVVGAIGLLFGTQATGVQGGGSAMWITPDGSIFADKRDQQLSECMAAGVAAELAGQVCHKRVDMGLPAAEAAEAMEVGAKVVAVNLRPDDPGEAPIAESGLCPRACPKCGHEWSE